jgi:hypothetical protein
MSPELRLMASPARTYAALARTAPIGPLAALRRPVLSLAVIGSSVAILATRHATPALVASTMLCWSPVLLAQIAIALAVIAGPARRTVGIWRALDLFFASHAPWSLWLLALVAWAPTSGDRSQLPIFLSAVFPILLTPRILAAYFREVLRLEPRAARMRTAVHQGATWTLLLVALGAAVAATPRIVELLGSWIG